MITQNPGDYTLAKINDTGRVNGNNNVVFTNTLENSDTITGLFIDIFPYILILIVGMIDIYVIRESKKLN